MYDCGLILEGGGMRGVYTAGVLDSFLDNGIEFSSCYGVSAGGCHCCSFLSKQRKRAFNVNVDYLKDKHYASFYSLITTGDFFGAKMVYDDIPNKLSPYDYDKFDEYIKNGGKFKVVVTNVDTGKPEYIDIKDMHSDIIYVRASSSLPFFARIVSVDGKNYLDGGVTDSIPLKKSQHDGNKKNVVILTRDITYRKEPNKVMPLIRKMYKKYPNLVKDIQNRHINYNHTLDYIRREEKNGDIFVIRPKKPVKLKRLEKNKKKLYALYKQGYADGMKSINRLKAYLEK